MPELPDYTVDPTALVDSSQVGSGTVIWEFVRIMEGAVIGKDCKIGGSCFIESGATLGDRVIVKNGSLIWHGVNIGDDVFVGPNVVFTNDLAPRVKFLTQADEWLETRVEAGATIGAQSTILSGITIGHNAMIGAGAVVTGDVQDHALVYGNPATQAGWSCTCGGRLSDTYDCSQCGRTFQLTSKGLVDV